MPSNQLTYKDRKKRGDVSFTIWLSKDESKKLDKLQNLATKAVLDATGFDMGISRTSVVKRIIVKALEDV